MLIEFHILKNYPPVNLNRDEGGAPKSCFFGGVQRGRISSQCLKRSWRTSPLFQSLTDVGIRTRELPAEVGRRLQEMGVPEDMAKEAAHKLTVIGTTDEKGTKGKKGTKDEKQSAGGSEKDKKDNDEDESKKNKTQQTIFYSERELEKIVLAVKSAIDEDKTIGKFKKRTASQLLLSDCKGGYKILTADIAIFGRMVTSVFFADVDAALSVGHAISTHPVIRESDYFTTVDELLKQGSKAAMVGDADFNSCCYYEYASLDTDILRSNMECCPDRDVVMEKILSTLIRAMAHANPSGKQNAFAGPVSPEVMMVECKGEKIPLSYVNAFEKPVHVWGSQPDIVSNSIKRLAEHVDQMDHAFELPVLHRAWFAPRYKENRPKRCEEYENLSALADACAAWLQEDQEK